MDWNTIIFGLMIVLGLLGMIVMPLVVIATYITLKKGQAISLKPESVYWTPRYRSNREQPYIYFQSKWFISRHNKKGIAFLEGFTVHRYIRRGRDQEGKFEVGQKSYDLLYRKFGRRLFLVEANPTKWDIFRSLLVIFIGFAGSVGIFSFSFYCVFFWKG